jgi:hypothetical protein
MRLSVRFTTCFAVVSALLIGAGNRVVAQSSTAPATSTNGTYISIDPLAKVRYNNRYDVSLGLGYDHAKAGPTILSGSNLGGLDLSGSYWFAKRWGVEGSTRAYLGSSGVGTGNNTALNYQKGQAISQYFMVAGPEWLGPHNKHGDLIAHILAGAAYGDFEGNLHGLTAQNVAFYNNQISPAAIVGGHIDLNRNEHWVFRITPDAVMTHYSINYAPNTSQFDVNFAISVGLQYKFSKKR